MKYGGVFDYVLLERQEVEEGVVGSTITIRGREERGAMQAFTTTTTAIATRIKPNANRRSNPTHCSNLKLVMHILYIPTTTADLSTFQ